MSAGRVVRIIGGFYFVEPLPEAGPVVECAIRGRLKLKSEGILVGDLVDFEIENEKGVITGIRPRQTILTRPYVANVELLVLVFAHQNPDPVPALIDKFLILAEASGIPYLLVFNKTDLVGKGKADKVANKYLKYGYNVLCTSVRSHLGKRRLLAAISGKVAVFAGPSGVGKSALLNMIAPGLGLRTGEVSGKIGRGKHTTREAQLLKVKSGSYVVDTPGFSQLALDFIAPEQLSGLFPDLAQYAADCRFASCLHLSEPGCRVKEAANSGAIDSERYQSYLELFSEVKGHWDRRFR